MTTISATMVTDSISHVGSRLSTMLLRYPRCIHSEFMTHRVFSRNASSSRAIPVKRLIQDVLDDPFVPLHWGKNQKGMQAGKETSELVLLGGFNAPFVSNETAWLSARDKAVGYAEAFAEAGYHKQIVNRLLEPFAHINVLVTGTQWSNFLALRDHPDAEPHIQTLAQQVRHELETSTPETRNNTEWHLPFISFEERKSLSLEASLRVSVARCARTSYFTHEGKIPNLEEDLKLADRLLASVPLHASPAEHQATPEDPFNTASWGESNLKGWLQYRKTLPGECQ